MSSCPEWSPLGSNVEELVWKCVRQGCSRLSSVSLDGGIASKTYARMKFIAIVVRSAGLIAAT